MGNYEIMTLTLSVVAIIISISAVYVAGKANSLNKNMFKRQGVIDLHMAWQGINQIDRNVIITSDVVKAVNAMTLTASLWNHDIIEKNILYQTYWYPFKELFENLNTLDILVPGQSRTCKSLMTSEIQKAYEGMKSLDLNKVIQTKL